MHLPDHSFSNILHESIEKNATFCKMDTWSAEEDAISSRRVSEYDEPLTGKNQSDESKLVELHDPIAARRERGGAELKSRADVETKNYLV